MHDEEQLQGYYEGVVTRNDDPLRIGRVKVLVPGLIEPESAWALPAGMPAGGEAERGGYFPPDIGAEVGVMFAAGGNRDRPVYFCGPWGAPNGAGQAPSWLSEAQSDADAPKMRGFQFRRFDVLLDERDGQERLVIRDRAFANDFVEIDGVKHGVTVSGSAAVRIVTVGVLSLEALQVVINGRVVKEGNDPI